jgi:hypothetical protein
MQEKMDANLMEIQEDINTNQVEMKANQAKMDDNLRERWQDAQPN